MTGRVVLSLLVGFAAGCGHAALGVDRPSSPVPATTPVVRDGTLACDSVFLVHMRPTCVVPLSDEVRAKRETYIALVMKDGIPFAVERRHGLGGFSPNNGRSIFQYEYQDGKVRREIEMHADGRLLGQTLYEEGGKLRIFRDPAGNPQRDEGSDATRARVENDARGFERERRYYDESGKPVRNKSGAYMQRYERDQAGNIIRIMVFDERGAPAQNNMGWHRQDEVFGENGGLLRRAYFGTRGERVLDTSGVGGLRRQCDAQGQALFTEILGTDDRPLVDSHGRAAWLVRRDEHGSAVEISTLSLDGKVVQGDSDYAIERRKYDSLGRTIEYTYFGLNGVPVLRALGYAGTRYQWDDSDHIVETTYLDESGRPTVASRLGYAHVQNEFDANGRNTRTLYFDEQGKPARDREGAATREYTYDEADRVVVEMIVEAGRLHDCREGWAKAKMDYPADGGPPRRHFYRATGEEVELLGGRFILVSFAGAKGTVGAIRSKEEARQRAEQARGKLLSGERWQDVARGYDDGHAPIEGSKSVKGVRIPQLDEALEKTSINGITDVVETQNGYFVMQRIP